MRPAEKYSTMIKEEAHRLGFSFCGIARAEFLEEEAPLLERWLKNGYQGQMQYMENHFDQRLDPRKLVDGARSVISLMLNYFPKQEEGGGKREESYKVSKYAYGRDYHKVIRKKLKQLHHFILENIGEINGRAFVDSAPMLDKAWAKRAGLGWVGKHSNIINKKQGSFFFLAELVIDLELAYDKPMLKEHCGSCTLCIDACPTGAIVQPQVVDGSRCISYLTIELKGNMPAEYHGRLHEWIFGCDICQDVCPWNRFSKPHQEADFKPLGPIQYFSKADWEEITEDLFDKAFAGSPLKRTKFSGIKRNILAIKKIK